MKYLYIFFWLIMLIGCEPEQVTTANRYHIEDFVLSYNSNIKNWVKQQLVLAESELNEFAKSVPKSKRAEDLQAYENRMVQLKRDLDKWEFRSSVGDCLRYGKLDEIPSDLVWDNGMNEPEIGDPLAKKGGVFRRHIPNFPATLRPFGDNSNHAFRGDLYDNIDLSLVMLHPETMKMIPGIAREWATSKDGRTIYFRLDPTATYSDGVHVKAKDFLYSIYIRVSDHIVNPSSKQYFRENVASMVIYNDETLSITLSEAKLYAPMLAGALVPSPPHFYHEYGPDYIERYQWKFPPTTGAYQVDSDGVVKGVSITQTHVKHWWAEKKKYYQYRFNPDQIVHTVVRDDSKAFEWFRAGEIDTFYLTRPELWYEKSEFDAVHKGYIERATFYNRYPKVPRGIYMNVNKPILNDQHVRVAIHYSMNWSKVIEVMYRGDYQRLNVFNEGYDVFSDPSIKARPYSIQSARDAFAAAGYRKEDIDGVLMRPDGSRLSVSVTYPSMAMTDRIFSILKEDARACGLELRLDGVEATVAYKKQMQKQHEMYFGGWMIGPPTPEFHQFLHSSNAFDAKGNVKVQTNNLFGWGRADTDQLCDQVRAARNEDELKQAAWKLQRVMHDEAIFLPAYTVDFMRIGSWRWIRWPNSRYTKMSPSVVYDPHDTYVYWVDQEMKEETLRSRRQGVSYPECNEIINRPFNAITPNSKP